MYYSQEGQDEFLDTQIFKGHRGGVFVDVGAYNGVTINNTLFFEKEREWSGLLIEPLPEIFKELQKNRPNARLENCAVSMIEGNVDFLSVTGYSEMTSGILSNYDSRHTARIDKEVEQFGGTKNIIQVPSYPLSVLFKKHRISHVHYLSIDVEGSEMSVVKSIDYSAVNIDVIGFENNYNDRSTPIVKYLRAKGYRLIPRSGADIFMIHQNSSFLKNIQPPVRA